MNLLYYQIKYRFRNPPIPTHCQIWIQVELQIDNKKFPKALSHIWVNVSVLEKITWEMKKKRIWKGGDKKPRFGSEPIFHW